MREQTRPAGRRIAAPYAMKYYRPAARPPVEKSLDEIDFDKGGGLVPVIVQDAKTMEVLTLAYANRESLERTASSRTSWFWSRSRGRLWMKGEESGNTQAVRRILVDCDSDAVIYQVEPAGPACHMGERTCFHNGLDAPGGPPRERP